MNDLTMCLKWRASGALATVRSRLCLRVFQIKFKATLRLGNDNTAETAPKLHFDGHGGLSLLLTSVGKL